MRNDYVYARALFEYGFRSLFCQGKHVHGAAQVDAHGGFRAESISLAEKIHQQRVVPQGDVRQQLLVLIEHDGLGYSAVDDGQKLKHKAVVGGHSNALVEFLVGRSAVGVEPYLLLYQLSCFHDGAQFLVRGAGDAGT